MLYSWKVRFLKIPTGNWLWRYWQGWCGRKVGHYRELQNYVWTYAAGRSFLDVGCMWGVNGDYAFLAEDAGATVVKALDVFGPTPEFEAKRISRNSAVHFILGDVTQASTIEAVGEMDVVLCAGVLYHHPSPFDLLVALRRICRERLILRTSTIPEIPGFPNAAVYYPMLPPKARPLWDLRAVGLQRQVGIADGFEAEQGYGNWFWGLTPSCLRSLLETTGFSVEHEAIEAFARTMICRPVRPPFLHRLPDEERATQIALEISMSGRARPA
jgi:SAM-dependent methyltransferase